MPSSETFLYNTIQDIINNKDSRKITMFDFYKAENIPKVTSLSELTQI